MPSYCGLVAFVVSGHTVVQSIVHSAPQFIITVEVSQSSCHLSQMAGVDLSREGWKVLLCSQPDFPKTRFEQSI